MKQRQVWSKSGKYFQLADTSRNIKKLPVGIYNVMLTLKGFVLEQVDEQFRFDHKIYGLERGFIDRVKKTYTSIRGNLGLLLNGPQGTGKTVTGKILANEMNIPIIMITAPEEGLINFLASIEDDVIIFIDEYEKIFKESHEMLAIMDGMLSTTSRRMFILTSNDMHIAQYMLQRPSRIRYIKNFEDLPADVIEEVVDDILLWPEHKEVILDYISGLDLITIDLVKAVVNEVNIHNESPENFKDVFNTKNFNRNQIYDVYQVIDGKEKLIAKEISLNKKLSVAMEKSWLSTQSPFSCGLGIVEKYLGDGKMVVSSCPVSEKNPSLTLLEHMANNLNSDSDYDLDEFDNTSIKPVKKRSKEKAESSFVYEKEKRVLLFKESRFTHSNYYII